MLGKQALNQVQRIYNHLEIKFYDINQVDDKIAWGLG